MELIITKNGHIFNRCGDDEEIGEYELKVVEDSDIPTYPTEKASKGKQWTLDYVGVVLTWILTDRPLTMEERMEAVEEKQNAWKPNEWVEVGERRFYDGHWYSVFRHILHRLDGSLLSFRRCGSLMIENYGRRNVL